MSRAALLGIALLVVGALIALTAPVSSSLALSIYFGRTIVAAHALPAVLGPQSFTAASSPWLAQGWLGAAVTSLVYAAGGYPALVAGNILLAGIAFVLVAERCRAHRLSLTATALALALAILASLGTLCVGGATADLALAAAFLACLDRLSGRWLWAAVPLTLLWVNLSTIGLIAPLFALCALVGALIEERVVTGRVRELLALTLLLVVAAIATPAGVNALTNYSAYLGFDSSGTLGGWQPARVSAPALFAGLVPAMIFCAWLGLRRSGDPEEVAVSLAAIVLALLHGKYLGIAGLAVSPVLAAALDRVTMPSPQRAVPALPSGGVAAALALVALLGACVSFARGTQILDAGRDQYAAIDRLARDGRPHRLLCLNPSWCNYALLRGAPSLQVFFDGRQESYPQDVRDDFVTIVLGRPQWLRRVKSWNIDTVVTTPNGISLLALLPQWHALSLRGNLVIYQRR
ncbi:MAG TPA: hypothetical protein VME66_14075 [Candidatus Acidoferrales bacterium]|nr:hypothetical protein [Candidatus Acidoferrales bacterium]